MAKSEKLLAKNLRYLRLNMEHKHSQEALGEKLGVTRSAISSYEDGRAEPRTDLLIKIAALFKVSTDALLKLDIEKVTDTQLLQEENSQKRMSGVDLRVITVPVDQEENEKVVLVPETAAAGYSTGFSDPEYIKDLPQYSLPFLPKGKSYRAFEIKGDSMLPIPSGSIVIGEYIEDWENIKNGEFCVVATKSDGYVFKKVYNKLHEDRHHFLLKSTNLAYEPYDVHVDNINEVWKYHASIIKQFPEESATSISDMKEAIFQLQDEVRNLKFKN